MRIKLKFRKWCFEIVLTELHSVWLTDLLLKIHHFEFAGQLYFSFPGATAAKIFSGRKSDRSKNVHDESVENTRAPPTEIVSNLSIADSPQCRFHSREDGWFLCSFCSTAWGSWRWRRGGGRRTGSGWTPPSHSRQKQRWRWRRTVAGRLLFYHVPNCFAMSPRPHCCSYKDIDCCSWWRWKY